MKSSDFGKLGQICRQFLRIPSRLHSIQQALGRIEARQIKAAGVDDLQRAEFRVSSQWGEDGIIQFLVQRVPIEKKVFVEFGVQDYTEANTRFLLQNDNWAGLILDSNCGHIARIREDEIYWRFNLKAICALVTRENINQLICGQGLCGDIGLLSIDIDGNDYWVWEAIDCVQPRIVIIEYNSLFGPRAAVTVPYDPAFDRRRAHYSHLFWGSSIAGLCTLSQRKGYGLVGSNSAGNNAFFVRSDVLSGLRTLTPEEAYVRAQWRDSRDKDGSLSFFEHSDAFGIIRELKVYDLEAGKLIRVGDVL